MTRGANMLLPFELDRTAPVEAALQVIAHTGNVEQRGAVFTKVEVVDGILNLCGYTADDDLLSKRLIEPSVGDGEFLLAAATRLLESCRRHHGPPSDHAPALANCLRGVELHHSTYESTKEKVVSLLVGSGLNQRAATGVAERWVRQDDFLLTSIDGEFDVAVGNPPYVRQERIPDVLLSEYKRRFATLYDRADLYVLFFEKCLDLLRPQGVLGFICANRWTKNKYGGPLREKVANNFNLDVYIDLEQVDAFHEQVDAYPAITIIRRVPQSVTRVVTDTRNGCTALPEIFDVLSHSSNHSSSNIAYVHEVGCGRDPWLVDAPEILETLRDLEHQFPTLEQAGAKVGIGVATGADKIYIGQYEALPVEKERRLPLAMSADLTLDGVKWSGKGIVNPWMENGSLADLNAFPKFAAYMQKHESALKRRHTAQKNPGSWYKTIDRVYPDLTTQPKLLIPDIKGEATVVYDEGKYYPHHNLYVVTSQDWDLRALQAVLRSSIALTFVAAYCVRMSGGFLRFQAQYLRRIRIPRWSSVSEEQRQNLLRVATSPDQNEVDNAVAQSFGLGTKQARQFAVFAASARVTKEKK